MKARPRKKIPSDYPVLGYRVSQEDYIRLSAEIEKIQERFNRSLKSDQKAYAKNEIFLSALQLGLSKLKKVKS